MVPFMDERIFWRFLGTARTQAGDEIKTRVDALATRLSAMVFAGEA